MRAAAWLVALAACAHTNDELLRELESVPPPAGAAQDSPPRELRVPLEPGAFPVVRGKVNGVETSILIDTGTSGVVLTGGAARRARPYLLPGSGEALAPNARVEVRRALLESLEFGGARFARVEVIIGRKETQRTAEVIVGCSILSRYRVTFDHARRELRLSPARAAAPDPLFCRVQLNGKELLLLVDSGARGIYLEPWAFRAIGARARLELAGRTWESLAVKEASTFQGVGGNPAGLLGISGIPASTWTVDFAARTLTVN